MKILIIYFSQTGNTEKIASAIYDAASRANVADLRKLDEIDPDKLHGYDLIFIGTPIHAGDISNETKGFLGHLPELPGTQLAVFITHAAPTYPQQTIDKMVQLFVDVCNERSMEYKGCFDCQGYLADIMHKSVQEMQNVTDEEWEEKVRQMTGHPDDIDLANAGIFAKSVLSCSRQ